MPHTITLRFSDDQPASPRWRAIERIADADRRSLGCRFGQPCDPARLTELYDVCVILQTHEDYERYYGRCMRDTFRSLSRWSGVLLVLEDGSQMILLNPDHSVLRRRLTLAHEFGHLAFSHRPIAVDLTEELEGAGGIPRTRFNDEQELQAYGYALALLLPYAPIMQMLQQGATHRGMAHHFGTSVEAVAMRLKTVGLWGMQT